MPADILQQASRRLSIAAALMSGERSRRWTQAEAIAWWQEHAKPHEIARAGGLVY